MESTSTYESEVVVALEMFIFQIQTCTCGLLFLQIMVSY